MIEEKSVNVNGINISYLDSGGPGTPLIFIHGFPFNKLMWIPQYEFLKDLYRVIIYDLRGYGKSTKDDKPFTIDLFSDDFFEFIGKLNINKAVVCGLSMGGYILLNALKRSPEKFSAIILADTQCIADSPEGREKRFKTIEMINSGGFEEFMRAFIGNIFSKKSFNDKHKAIDEIKEMVKSASKESITSTLKALADRSETCSTLNKINVPVLILCGKEDAITTVERAEQMHKDIPQSELFIIEDAGHMSNMEQPETFNMHINNFVSGL